MIAYIFGAAEINNYSFLQKKDFSNSFIICADGGIKHIKKLKLTPDVVIGDFDSSDDTGEYKEKYVYPTEKDDTDLGLAIKYAAEKGFLSCVAIGCLGGRLDHTFSSICLLKYAYDLGIELVLEDENTKVYLSGKYKKVYKDDYKYVSVFPFGNEANGVSLSGFKYPLSDAFLNIKFPLGVSNELVSDYGEIRVNEGMLIVMEVREC